MEAPTTQTIPIGPDRVSHVCVSTLRSKRPKLKVAGLLRVRYPAKYHGEIDFEGLGR